MSQVELGTFITDTWESLGLEPADTQSSATELPSEMGSGFAICSETSSTTASATDALQYEISIESRRAGVTISVRDAGPGLAEHLSGSDFESLYRRQQRNQSRQLWFGTLSCGHTCPIDARTPDL